MSERDHDKSDEGKNMKPLDTNHLRNMALACGARGITPETAAGLMEEAADEIDRLRAITISEKELMLANATVIGADAGVPFPFDWKGRAIEHAKVVQRLRRKS